MTLQNRTLNRYRQFFPEETLRHTSQKTGIQITRVFRLFGGKTMKVGELEAFEKAINDKLAESPGFQRLTRALDEGAAILTNEELSKIASFIERKITNKTYGRTYIRSLFQDANIA